jgi:hypothetical protein
MTGKHGNQPVTNDDLDEALALHAQSEREEIQKEIQKMTDAVLKAFPDGVENHRRAHEKMIKAAEAEERFWTDLKADIAKKSIWGILHILTILVLAGISAKLFGLPLITQLLGGGKP